MQNRIPESGGIGVVALGSGGSRAGQILDQFVSLRAHIKKIISAHLLCIHLDAS